jgi:pimeloyl-ACP methyl ester carboxylesterase
MTADTATVSPSPASSPAEASDASCDILVGCKEGLHLFDKGKLDTLMQLPLPGVVIFVHGVNSDGEWFEATEEGLCHGLNERLARCNDQLKHCGAEAGQLSPAKYMRELTDDGFINPKMTADTFIQGNDTFSPVIRFRWGYKANGEELQQYGSNIYLNEENYWGGGPFANGCTSLPDLWGAGLNDRLFLWLRVQHMNPTPDRQVFACPPRPYYVLAAYRLAKLVESLRKLQADLPITIVCHSQGNMIGIASAFLGDAMDANCVADSYVLCNAPYSLVESDLLANWSERDLVDPAGGSGRQTREARLQTLAAFFDIVRKRRDRQQDPIRVDKHMANTAYKFDAVTDRKAYGLGGSTYGRVTLYCNPHDAVISALTVQGIGWRGMDAGEIAATRGEGTFTQRVFAQGFKVGEKPVFDSSGKVLTVYDAWTHHYAKPDPVKDKDKYWSPSSPPSRYDFAKGMYANDTAIGKLATFVFSPLIWIGSKAMSMPINALPPQKWVLPLAAPGLPKTFEPESLRLETKSGAFDQGFDPPGAYRDKSIARSADDPYAGKNAKNGRTDEALGNKETEASLRYEDHAALRMQARREGLYKNKDQVVEEDRPEKASEGYKQWRSQKIANALKEGLDVQATDHSTIMTNPMHAQKALAYDIAIGCCDIPQEKLHQIRIAADWRLLVGLEKEEDPHKMFFEYFDKGKFKGVSTHDWANNTDSEARMPSKIVNERRRSMPDRS